MANGRKISKALTKALADARNLGTITLTDSDRYIIFSDHHKGARNGADDFAPAEQTYLHAINSYFHDGYTLLNLGDSEELWEENEERAIASYSNVLEAESKFYAEDRYLKVYGNHDSQWAFQRKIEVYLYRFFPNIKIPEGFVMEYQRNGRKEGEIFLAHGHQGTLGSDQISLISMYAVRFFWRTLQILFSIGYTDPSDDACLRAKHDTQMYEWARTNHKLIFIAGHTHRPIWSSMTHLERLLLELRMLQQIRPPQPIPINYNEEVARLKKEIAERFEKTPPCDDTVKIEPCYFNTGCCSFSDGDITGLEIDNGQIRLIKWGANEDGEIERKVLEHSPLTEIFDALS